MATMGERIRTLRKARGWSQDDLAVKLDLSRGAISSWEDDRNKPTVDKLEKLADLFNVSMDYLAGRTEKDGKTDVPPDVLVSTFPREHLAGYDQLSDDMKEAVDHVLKAVFEKYGRKKKR